MAFYVCGLRARVFKFALMSVKCLCRAGRQTIAAVCCCFSTSVFTPLLLKSALPQTSRIGLKYQSGASAKRRQAPLALYCPPTRRCSGRTGTAGGFLHLLLLLRRLLLLLQLPRLQLQLYSGRAPILPTERKGLIKSVQEKKKKQLQAAGIL